MNAECEATGLGLHFVCTLGAMMTENVYYYRLICAVHNRGCHWLLFIVIFYCTAKYY